MSEFRRKLMMAYAANLGRDDIIYPGLIAAWDIEKEGKNNESPNREILKDLTGNGHDITLNNFSFSEMSGYGGYNISFLDWNHSNVSNQEPFIKTSNKVIANSPNSPSTWLIAKLNVDGQIIPSLRIKVSGLDNGVNIIYTKGYQSKAITNITQNGEYVLPKVVLDENIIGFKCFQENSSPITIELLPEYPDALVFDGVDDYGINEDMPIQTDYTVILKADNFTKATCGIITKDRVSPYINAAFSLRKDNLLSFGENNNIRYPNGIVYFSKNNYNGTTIRSGNSTDIATINIGCIRAGSYYSNIVFYCAYLFDRSLDEQEIKAFIRKYIDSEYLLPSEIPTPDCYYDLGQGSNDDENRETIKDYSGNGNDAVAHNFAWSGMSGYGGYNTSSINTWNKYDSNTYRQINSNKFEVDVNSNGGGLFIMWASDSTYLKSFTIKFDKSNVLKSFGDLTIEQKDDFTYKISNPNSLGGNKIIIVNSEIIGQTITIELLSEYPGALVFDGVDDYVSLDTFDSGFKTMFMVCRPFEVNDCLYNQRTTSDLLNYTLWVYENTTAYSFKNTNGTYINGILNENIQCQNLLNKKHLITVIAEKINEIVPMIGTGNYNIYNPANMALYKFLGFKEALTEDQIQYVIKKYNLLDGVDEIEVN